MENEKRLPEKFVSVTGELEEDDDQNEEERMKKFFALIRGFQEARNRRRNELNELEARNKKKMRNSDDHRESGWVPAFQWEDFTQEIEFRKQPPPPPPSLLFPAGVPNSNLIINQKEDKNKLEEHNEGGLLDLKLAL